MATQKKTAPVADAASIMIHAPAAGENITLASTGAERLVFGFTLANSTFSRSGNDLTVNVDGGGKIVVENFFAVGAEGSLPDFELPDGSVVTGREFLSTQSPNMDITTAAGPQTNSASGSSLSEYADGAGSLIGSVSRLGSLGTDQWSSTRQTTELPQTQSVDTGLNDGPISGPVSPETPPVVTPVAPPVVTPVAPPVVTPVVTGPTYDARAVLFTHNTTSLPTIAFTGVGANAGITWHDDAFKDFFTVNADSNGQLTLTLNQAGKDYLAEQGANNVYGYITLTDDNGVQYTVQVVLNQSDDVTSHVLDAENAELNGGYDLGAGGLKHGEWDQGQNFTKGNLTSSDLADSIRFTGTVSDSTINAGLGKDTVSLGTMQATTSRENTVTADGGTVTVEKVAPGTTAYAMTTDGGTNSINAQSADIFLTASGNAGIVMNVKNGNNTVETKLGDIKLVAHSDINASSTGMYTNAGGTNTLIAGKGSVSIDVDGAGGGSGLYNYSARAGQNNITAGKDIDINVNVAKYASGMSGQGTLKAGNDITINASSTEYAATGVGSLGTTLIEAGGAFKVHTEATGETLGQYSFMSGGNVQATGLSAGAGTLTVSANEMDIAAKVSTPAGNTKDGATATAIATSQGTATLTATRDITLSASKDVPATEIASSGARGIYQWTGSALTVESKEGNITINADDNAKPPVSFGAEISTGAIGVYTGSASETHLKAENGTISMLVNQGTTSPGTNAWGVLSTANSTVSIDANAVDFKVSANENAIGTNVYTSGKTNITANSIDFTLNAGSAATGMRTEFNNGTGNGSNTLTARSNDGSGTTTMNLVGGVATAMSADIKGSNLIDADHVVINATGNYSASAMGAASSSTNTVKSGDVDITLKGNNTTGMSASGSSVSTQVASNLVQGTGEHATFDLNMTVTGTSQYGGTAYGMNAGAGGSNTIKDFERVNITGTARAEAYGVSATAAGVATSQNTIAATGDIDINMHSTGSAAYGAKADAGTNTLTGENINVQAQSDKSFAQGVAAVNSGKNILTAHDTLDIDVISRNSSSSSASYGVQATGKGENIMNAGTINVSLDTSGGGYAAVNADGGINTMTATGDVTLESVSSATNASAMNAVNASHVGIASGNTLTAKDVTLRATTSNSNSIAYTLAAGDGAKNLINADNVDITAINNSTTGSGNSLGSYAIYARDGGTTNTVNATGSVTVNAASTIGAGYAMRVIDNGTNIVSANSVSLNAQGLGKAGAYGMYTKIGSNTIQAHDDAQGMDVYITARSGTFDKAYAMYSEAGYGGINLIKGSSQADLIRLEGNISAGTLGNNAIRTGGGNDRIELDGKVFGAASLDLKGGAGYDTLVLHARDFADFQTRYGDWLKGNSFAGMEIEHIQVVLDSAATNQQDILNWFSSNMPSAGGNVDVAYDHSAQLLDITVHHVDYDSTAYAATESNVDGKDLHFHSTGDDYVHIKGDVTHSAFAFDAGHDTLNIAGSLSDSTVQTDAGSTGTLHVEAGALINTHMELLGGTNDVTLHGNVDNYSTLTFGNGNDNLNIQGDFTGHVTMGSGNDLVTLHGSAHGGIVDGGTGHDTLTGDAGNNILVGGAGNDMLTGGAGADTFVWKAGDQGTPEAPSRDVITDFNSAEGDMLDLSGLLSGSAKDHLDNFLSIDRDNGNTVLHISTSGESAAGHFDQVIVLQNSTLTDEQLLQHLLLTSQ